MRRRITYQSWRKAWQMLLVFVLLIPATCLAQIPSKIYTVKNGKMYIELSKQLSESSLDSFILQFDLEELSLKECLKAGFLDSLISQGWTINRNDRQRLAISKPLFASGGFEIPEEKFFLDKPMPTEVEFPSVSNKVVLGYNQFRNKYPFSIRDSVVRFYLRQQLHANKVMLAGSFNDWKPDVLSMIRTDSGWIADVRLKPGKYWYKFIVNGEWQIDHDNRLTENDGRGNTNSIFYYTNTLFRLPGYEKAGKVILTGSFNDWNEKDLLMNRTEAGWEIPVYLADGTHRYRFIIDGKWITDPNNADKLPNESKEFNSILRIGNPSLFKLKGYPEAKEVVLSGSFNKWRRDELFMKKTVEGWELEYTLGPGNHAYRIFVDGKEIPNTQNTVSVNNDNKDSTFIIVGANYTFRLKGFSKAWKVHIAGDFNEWNPTTLAMTKDGDEWVAHVHLTPGKHLYKFIVDDKWIIDPGNKLWEQNEYGTGNSVLWIGQ